MAASSSKTSKHRADTPELSPLTEPQDAREELVQETIVTYRGFRDALERRSEGREQRGESLYKFSPYQGQGRVLLMIGQHPGLAQADIARELGVRPQTLSVALQKLERAGLVQRAPKPGDKRVLCVTLTQRGRQACEAMEQRVPYSSSMFEALDDEELVSICGMFNKLRVHLEAEIEAAERVESFLQPEDGR